MRTALYRTLLGVGLPALVVGIVPLAAQQAPKNLQVTVVSPTTVKLTWTPGINASMHKILRSVPGAAAISIASVPAPAAAYTDGSAPAGTDLVYQVVGKYPNGTNAYTAKIQVKTPAAANTAATTSGPSTPPASSPPATSQPASSPAAIPSTPVLTAVPVLRTATLAPVNVPAAAAPPAAPLSGKYRVVANGFSVIQQGHSHHDDVYGGFVMLHFDRQAGQLKNQDARRTKILGDVNGRVFGEVNSSANRLRAGTASATGGLKNGDSYPDISTAKVRSPQGPPPNRETFPFEVWTGDLTNASDAVIILPSLWSRDGKTQPYDDWQSSELTAASQIWWDPAVQQGLRGTSLGVLAPAGSATPSVDPLGRLAGAAFQAGLGQPWALAVLFDPSAKDRPIGLNPQARGLPRRAIVLTREMIEAALNGPKAPLSPTMLVPNYPAWMLAYLDVPVGVIPVLLSDYVPPPGEPLKWTYMMYLQVERM